MNEVRAWIPAIVGAAAATLGCVLGLVVALVFPSGPGWLLPLLTVGFGLGLGAMGAVVARRSIRSRAGEE